MSQQAAAEFLEKVETDSELKNKVMTLGSGASVEDVLDVAAAAGYQFNTAELMAAGKLREEVSSSAPGGELSESDLDAVAGGAKGATIYISRNSVIISVW
ncbi:MAG: Nif11-like leader peptide family natural product precursor [Chloroflexi bacterium]|uniref:Nif11-like leader peptide family RiPP n=1 Tax=Candidatus Chlorohelix allophototropha TaxID=3003348 RepID=A0A8T7M0Q6_9CHLR|nr:Nif11-like leader peptide family natural product precursor [Chloroflexota bacterium]WJW67391.1 Nif11-like leader peptide family RiPP precursor [Chloroflexota bacterium L227-S17]